MVELGGWERRAGGKAAPTGAPGEFDHLLLSRDVVDAEEDKGQIIASSRARWADIR